ncbi:MAG: polyphosphate kinase 1 [Methanoregula sp.]|nr:MAG: polyphosphate kinase 1 [Methanoregula sp.]
MTAGPPNADFSDPTQFINRELGWLAFNRQVLSEAQDQSHPLLERVKFHAIFANNLDEFFMIRIAGLKRQLENGVLEAPPDGMTPAQQLAAIRAALTPTLEEQAACWREELIPQLAASGIHIHTYGTLNPEQQALVRQHFIDNIFPVLTPLAFDVSHPFPFISNLSLNLAIIIKDQNREYFARIKVPTRLFPRLLRIPVTDDPGRDDDSNVHFILLEEVIAANLDLLFPGLEVVAAYPFRITRDADLEIEEDEASDLLTAVEEVMEQRRTGRPVRIEVHRSMPDRICMMLENKLGISSPMLYRLDHPVGMADMMQMLSLDRQDLKDTPFVPSVPPEIAEGRDIFTAIQHNDVLLFCPYDSFSPVINFIRQAAHDPDVLAIKITLYRVGANSPVVAALMEARENGKAVAALIELKARFDEENNIVWARQLERAGVHVVYGIVGLKVHAKLCMVVRREKEGIRRYLHLGTGNYNATSSRIYTDFGIFTCDREIGADIADLFNFLTGYARIEQYRRLLVAPVSMRMSILERIEREVVRHKTGGDGRIIFKMNALVDRECITALYRASQAGVRVELQVRGICCLRPGLKGISENIRVTTIVGRFLEHARLYYFHNGGEREVLLGSADLMPRNLDRRVEILFPVKDPAIKSALLDTILDRQLHDTEKLRVMESDGTYIRDFRNFDGGPFNAQSWFIIHRGEWHRGST